MLDESPSTPQDALESLQAKLRHVTAEYTEGRLNPAQYNAIYRYYLEKRSILQHLLATNPVSPTWRAIVEADDAPFLREQFASRLLYCAVFRKGGTTPLLAEGKIPRKVVEGLYHTLQMVWDSHQWRHGLARWSLGDGIWLVLCFGAQAMTLTVFYLPPSSQQYRSVREVHQDFEQANASLLSRNGPANRMVFPQRALFNER